MARKEISANSLVSSLDHLEIPASRGASGTNRRTLFLDGVVRTAPIDGQRLAVELDWRLSDADGKVVGEHRATAEVRRSQWGVAGKQPYATLAERSVTGIAALVHDPTTQPTSASREPETRPFYVWPVAGAPGNGGRALSQAMGVALRAAKLPTTPEMYDDALVIAGSVRLMPPEKGRQQVEILWTVLDSSGREVAKVSQSNAVQEGTLDGDWGELAQIIADAAVPSVVDLVRRLPARAEAPSTPNGG